MDYEEDQEMSSSGEDMSEEVPVKPSMLKNILECGEEKFEEDAQKQQTLSDLLQFQTDVARREGYCVECESQRAVLTCNQCDEPYCRMCFTSLHRKGNRTKHETTNLIHEEELENESKKEQQEEEFELGGDSEDKNPDEDFVERAKYIPLRLLFKERKLLRLLEGSLKSSNYTDKVDRLNFKNRARRTFTQLAEICAILSGLVVAADYKKGQSVVESRAFQQYESFFKDFFEIGRRHKIMNPEKMRSEYGKLMYILQDSVSTEVQELLEFSCFRPIRTVYDYLKEGGIENMLKEDCMEIATRAVAGYTLDGRRKTRVEVRQEVTRREAAVKYLSSKYRNSNFSKDDIQQALYSIGDNNSFLITTRDPVEKMIRYLKKYFRPDVYEENYSLAIQGGLDGARLTHAHDRQYYYCLQSLTLWKEVSNAMFKLWYQADQDLLSTDLNYNLKDTGQGINRVQQCPRVENTMRQILHSVQRQVGQDNWVGSSVIHLGDHNVPNALMFIDKYTQIPYILNPIILVMERIEELADDERIGYFIEQFGGIEKLRKDILVDFFRFGFDGSGADNFFDAGSCIDGRLTSAWNWCSKLHSKPFYPIFKLTGFRGFDGY
mmetsp:Transcript_14705/g.25045  ORF Transcript_14705/g.25045 Transcript_14705/m.25045 type:complete len:606 (-) Transcript_14705:2-1819(-)